MFLAKTVARPKAVRKLINSSNKTKAMKKREKKLLKDLEDASTSDRITLLAELKVLSIGIQQTSEDAISEIFDSFSEKEQAEIREAQRQ